MVLKVALKSIGERVNIISCGFERIPQQGFLNDVHKKLCGVGIQ